MICRSGILATERRNRHDPIMMITHRRHVLHRQMLDCRTDAIKMRGMQGCAVLTGSTIPGSSPGLKSTDSRYFRYFVDVAKKFRGDSYLRLVGDLP